MVVIKVGDAAPGMKVSQRTSVAAFIDSQADRREYDDGNQPGSAAREVIDGVSSGIGCRHSHIL